MLTAKDIETIRSIARARSDYDTVKRLLAETRWEIEADEVDLGFLRVFIPDADDEYYRLIVGYRDPDHPPYCLLTFSLFPDAEEHLATFNGAGDVYFVLRRQTALGRLIGSRRGGEIPPVRPSIDLHSRCNYRSNDRSVYNASLCNRKPMGLRALRLV
jgi:hypothetical protein